MPRKRLIPSSDIPYHVSARCLNKEWFSIPLDEIWKIYSEYLHFMHHAFDFRIHSFVLMNNHYHLIVTTPQANLGEAMNYFQRETSRVIGFNSGRINQVYGGPYYWSLLNSNHYFQHAYKYIYRNPVEAGLCLRVEDYKYSTIHSLLGKSHGLIPVLEDCLLFDEVNRNLDWLNKEYPNADFRNDIRNALRFKEFKFLKQKGREDHPLDLIMI